MRRYETVVILAPEVPDDDVAAFTAKYGDLIKTSGEIIKIEDWGYKRLAYLIKKKERGRYILFDFVGIPSLIDELERQFKISEDVLKFLSVKVDDEVDLEAFKEKTEEAKEAAPEATAATPEPPSEGEPEPQAEQTQPDTEAAEASQAEAGATAEGTPAEEATPSVEPVKEGE